MTSQRPPRRNGTDHASRGPWRDERGQAAVELLAALPALVAVGFVVLQLLAIGYAAVLAGTAAEAGALALAGGSSAKQGVHRSLPGWSRARVQVAVSGGTVRVRLRPPSPLSSFSRRFEVTGRAAVGGP
jgi:hypothetical protein